MSRSQLACLLQSQFAFEQEAALPVFKSRTDDQHLDNVEIAWMLDQQRIAFGRYAGWWPFLSAGRLGMLVSTHIDYLAELWAQQPVHIANAIETTGTSSYTIVQAVKQEGRVAALARTVLVLVGDAGVEALPNEMRALMDAVLLRS